MIENTTRRPWLPGPSVEAYEAAGQRQVVASDAIPTDAPWTALLALGFTRGEEVDDLFTTVTLPAGWTRTPTKHPMWSSIVDTRGIVMVHVFYKAAPYDRKAHCQLARPGSGAASDIIFGDGEPRLPAEFTLFTDEEKADMRAEADTYMADVQRCPEVYADLAPRAQRLLDLLGEAGA